MDSESCEGSRPSACSALANRAVRLGRGLDTEGVYPASAHLPRRSSESGLVLSNVLRISAQTLSQVYAPVASDITDANIDLGHCGDQEGSDREGLAKTRTGQTNERTSMGCQSSHSLGQYIKENNNGDGKVKGRRAKMSSANMTMYSTGSNRRRVS